MSGKKHSYHQLPETETTVARQLYKEGSLSEEKMILLPLSVGLYGEPWRDSQDLLLTMMEHPNPELRANCVRGLGYIAFRFKKLDKRLVKPYVLRELRENTEFHGYVLDGIGDINHYLGWNLGRRPLWLKDKRPMTAVDPEDYLN